MNKSYGEVFVDEFAEGFELKFGKGVDGAKGWFMVFLEVDFEVISVIISKFFSFLLAKDIHKIMVFRRDGIEVDQEICQDGGDVCSFSRCFRSRQLEMEKDRSGEFAGTCKCSSTNQGDLGRSFRKG
jgi:hypothetical protein